MAIKLNAPCPILAVILSEAEGSVSCSESLGRETTNPIQQLPNQPHSLVPPLRQVRNHTSQSGIMSIITPAP